MTGPLRASATKCGEGPRQSDENSYNGPFSTMIFTWISSLVLEGKEEEQILNFNWQSW